jgi:hypothetical protein
MQKILQNFHLKNPLSFDIIHPHSLTATSRLLHKKQMKKYRWLRLLSLGLIVFQTFAFGFKVNVAHAAAPDTTITGGPASTTATRMSSFTFEASDSPATFECKLDSGAYVACTSPDTLGELDYGTHTFTVRATNAMDETDASPATFTWVISPFFDGDGSEGQPFIISTCDQLMYMNTFASGSYHFDLNTNIDCSGKTFTSTGTSEAHFNGIFNGHGYTISNIDSSDHGIFYYTEGATIANFILQNANFTADASIGAVAGYADINTNITNVHVYDTDITASNGYSGGIAGFLGNSSTISKASFIRGSVKSAGHPYIGGIAGNVELGSVQNVFSQTHIEGNQAGGIAGTVDYTESVISNAYSASTFDALGTGNGGLIGAISDGTVSHVFSATDMTVGGGTTKGAVFGTIYPSVSASDIVFDRTVTGLSACAGSGTVTCTAVNASNSQPNYFKNNHANAPLNAWDFDTVWHQNSADYPTLIPIAESYGFECTAPYRTLTTMSTSCHDIEVGFGSDTWEAQYKEATASEWTNITLTNTHSGEISVTASPLIDYDMRVRVTNDAGTTEWLSMESNLADGDSDGANDLLENNAPRAGDGNDDSQHDVEQANVYSGLDSVNGNYVTLVTTCDNNYNVQIGAESAEQADADYSYPAGLVGFVGRDCGTPGATVTVTLYFYGDYDASNFVLRKSNGGTYTTIDNATLTSVTIGGQKALKVTYQVVDGGPLDQDGTADGNIVDPVGIARSTVAPVTVPDTGVPYKNMALPLAALATGLISLVYVTRKNIFTSKQTA